MTLGRDLYPRGSGDETAHLFLRSFFPFSYGRVLESGNIADLRLCGCVLFVRIHGFFLCEMGCFLEAKLKSFAGYAHRSTKKHNKAQGNLLASLAVF